MIMKNTKLLVTIFLLTLCSSVNAQYSHNFYGDCKHVTLIQWNIALNAPDADKSDANIKRLSDTNKLFQEIQIQYIIRSGATRQSAIETAKNYKGKFYNHLFNSSLVNSDIKEIKNQIIQCTNSINQDSFARAVLLKMDL